MCRSSALPRHTKVRRPSAPVGPKPVAQGRTWEIHMKNKPKQLELALVIDKPKRQQQLTETLAFLRWLRRQIEKEDIDEETYTYTYTYSDADPASDTVTKR